jgi:hypothetical protein
MFLQYSRELAEEYAVRSAIIVSEAESMQPSTNHFWDLLDEAERYNSLGQMYLDLANQFEEERKKL